MSLSRDQHTATLLADGRVLICGGEHRAETLTRIRSCDLYDPVAGTFRPTIDMSGPRVLHTATVLADGRVLIAGGDDGHGSVSSAELFDPQTMRFSSAGSMLDRRDGFTATLLSDGRVLVAGGHIAGGGDIGRSSLESAEL